MIGRTTTLVVSIRTRKGFNQSGAPSGRKWATNILGQNISLEMINIIQNGIPRDIVNRRCLEVLNA